MTSLKSFLRYIILIPGLFLIRPFNVFCQEKVTIINHKHGLFESFFGDGENEFVCYNRVHRNYYMGIFSATILLSFVSVSRYRIKKKSADELRVKNDLIEEQNRDIIASINYAVRLQHAILPPPRIVEEALGDHFIFYQPRDIVSGDFYWVGTKGDEFLVAAVDCTGHGVPGALLSIVGYNALNTTVKDLGISKPSEVLSGMNRQVINTLRQDSNSDIKDGMDMALCCFNRKTRMLQYAGAHNPLYIISDGALRVINASKITVGSVETEVNIHPENHNLQLKEGDVFYIFTDGYADQFGGPENKKFKSHRLKKLLLECHTKPMKEQKDMLEKTLKDWKNKNMQVDDILIIGVRV